MTDETALKTPATTDLREQIARSLDELEGSDFSAVPHHAYFLRAAIAQAAERERALVEALAPFAREAETWWNKISDDARPWIAEPDRSGGDSAEFTIGDLRRAKTTLANLKGQADDK